MTIFKIRIYFFVISYNLKNIMNRNLLLPISSLFTYFNTKYYGLLLTLVLLMNIGSVAQTNAHTPTAGQYALTATMIPRFDPPPRPGTVPGSLPQRS